MLFFLGTNSNPGEPVCDSGKTGAPRKIVAVVKVNQLRKGGVFPSFSGRLRATKEKIMECRNFWKCPLVFPSNFFYK